MLAELVSSVIWVSVLHKARLKFDWDWSGAMIVTLGVTLVTGLVQMVPA